MANKADDNEEILDIIKQRMEVGLKRYGHGLRTADDTRQWGTAEIHGKKWHSKKHCMV